MKMTKEQILALLDDLGWKASDVVVKPIEPVTPAVNIGVTPTIREEIDILKYDSAGCPDAFIRLLRIVDRLEQRLQITVSPFVSGLGGTINPPPYVHIPPLYVPVPYTPPYPDRYIGDQPGGSTTCLSSTPNSKEVSQ
jgi:hypothetical protein